jgi:ferredoxin
MSGNGSTRKSNMRGIPGWVQAMVRAFGRLPLVERWHPWVRPDKTDMRWLPINEDIKMPGDTPLPLEVLDRIIEEASHRAIFDYCGCREGWKCKHYPAEIGCLLMGDSCIEAKRGSPFREVGVEEAKAHARRAIEAGLVPIVGKARADNFIFRIKDRKRLLTVCFCCECCCVTRYTSLLPLKLVEPSQPHLESLKMTFIPEKCKGCGKCVEHCYMDAITVVDKKAVISEFCRACGRCAFICPSDAIELEITDPEFIEKTIDRIRAYVKYD